MKIRNGFVSNSSSSSFTCMICNNTESGYNCSAEDLGFLECERGHIFCDEHWEYPTDEEQYNWAVSNVEKLKDRLDYVYDDQYEQLLKLVNDIESETVEMTDDTLSLIGDLFFNTNENTLLDDFCPLCTFKEIDIFDLKRYTLKETGFTELEAFNILKKTHNDRRIPESTYIEFTSKTLEKDEQELRDEIRKRFKNFEEFDKYLG